MFSITASPIQFSMQQSYLARINSTEAPTEITTQHYTMIYFSRGGLLAPYLLHSTSNDRITPVGTVHLHTLIIMAVLLAPAPA